MCAISIKLLIYIYKLQILKPYIAIFNFHICNILKIGRKLLGGTNTSYTEKMYVKICMSPPANAHLFINVALYSCS